MLGSRRNEWKIGVFFILLFWDGVGGWGRKMAGQMDWTDDLSDRIIHFLDLVSLAGWEGKGRNVRNARWVVAIR